ncbi:MAG: biotin transporter BioY [Bosea sp. (in: a-proteobacteria)]
MATQTQTAPAAASLAASTLIGSLMPSIESRSLTLVTRAILIVAASLAIVASARMSVPFWPVPMTMQSFAVIALGAALGPRAGVAAVMLYLGYGMMGLPVFANTPPAIPGPAYLLGPTGGFLVGFIPAAALAGWAAARGASMLRLAAGMVATHVVILGLGFVWLGLFAALPSGATGIGIELAFAKGVSPFLLGSVVKIGLAGALTIAGWNWLARRG